MGDEIFSPSFRKIKTPDRRIISSLVFIKNSTSNRPAERLSLEPSFDNCVIHNLSVSIWQAAEWLLIKKKKKEAWSKRSESNTFPVWTWDEFLRQHKEFEDRIFAVLVEHVKTLASPNEKQWGVSCSDVGKEDSREPCFEKEKCMLASVAFRSQHPFPLAPPLWLTAHYSPPWVLHAIKASREIFLLMCYAAYGNNRRGLWSMKRMKIPPLLAYNPMDGQTQWKVGWWKVEQQRGFLKQGLCAPAAWSDTRKDLVQSRGSGSCEWGNIWRNIVFVLFFSTEEDGMQQRQQQF